MSYNSKYTGAQVEELLDQIANGEVDNIYVTDFTIYDLLDVLDTGVSKSVDAMSLFAAIEANKIIIVPENDSNPLGGYVADTSANESCYILYVNYNNTHIELALSQHTSTEITPLDVYKVDMQEMLISGETIKTINGEEILGGGDIELATKEELNAKQDAIADLDAIRSGAEKGATALQEETYKGTIEAVDSNESVEDPELDYATTQYVDDAIASAITLTINASY